MSKLFTTKLLLLILTINLFFINSQVIDDIDIDIEDHLKGTVSEDEIRKAIKIETIVEDNSTEIEAAQNENKNSLETPEENNRTVSFHKSNIEENEIVPEKTKNPADIFAEIKGAYRIRSDEEAKFLFEIEDLTFLRFTYRSQSKASISVAKYVKSISDRLEHLVGFIMIDCDNYTPEWSDDCYRMAVHVMFTHLSKKKGTKQFK